MEAVTRINVTRLVIEAGSPEIHNWFVVAAAIQQSRDTTEIGGFRGLW
jgi:hypothetical protein